jgi:hypothetical protein
MSKPESKNESKTDTTSSAGPSASNPLPHWPTAFGTEAWANMTREGLARFEMYCDELAKLEAAFSERARVATQHATTMLNDSLSYLATLGNEARKMTVEAGHRAAEMMDSKA